jgi:hypothetical protein
MWLGDGWLSRDGERGVYHKVGLCGHASERAEVEKALGFIAEAFNVSCGPVTVRENTCQGLIYNVQVARLFEKWFFASPPAHKPKDSTSGKGVQAKVKRLAPWMWDLNDEQAWALLHGLAASDGDWRPDGSSRFHLTSPHLIYSLAVLAARMGYEPNIRVLLDPGKRGGTSQVSQRRSKAWEVMWQRAEQSVRRRYDLRLSDNLYVWHPVRYVKPASVPTPVYDLAVEDDHSFTVGLIAVHNCWGRMNDPHGAHLVLAQGEGTIDVPNRRRLGKKQEVVNILIEGASAGGLGVPTGAKGARSMQEDLLADLAEMEHTIRRAQDPSSWPDPARLRLARDEQVGWLVPGFGAVVFNDDGEKVASFTSIEDLARDGWVIA